MILDQSRTIAEVHDLLIGKMHSFFASAGSDRAVVGLSGGIDSAVVAALACEALGAGKVHGILMPSGFSTGHSVKDAEDLARNLGISCETVPIGGLYDSYLQALDALFADGQWTTAQENIQARIRGTILMAWSNRRGALLLNTSNKSELCMGYGTLYGDLCGAVMVIADLYKLQVYELARHINLGGELIPGNSITKAPSAELRSGQKDTDSLPDYPVLDPILYALHEGGRTPEALVREGADPALVERIGRLSAASAFKTLQIPPVFQVSPSPVVPAFKCL